eukprot:6485712-Amphidinium_carterae.1
MDARRRMLGCVKRCATGFIDAANVVSLVPIPNTGGYFLQFKASKPKPALEEVCFLQGAVEAMWPLCRVKLVTTFLCRAATSSIGQLPRHDCDSCCLVGLKLSSGRRLAMGWVPFRITWTRNLSVVYTNVLLYALCFQLQQPIEPFLVEKLGQGVEDADLAYGRLQTFFGIVQLVGSPLMGLILDQFGARFGFLLVFVGSALSYGLLACATNMWILYLSKVPALLQSAFLVSQTMVAQVTSVEERAEALGLLMTAYTIGASIGPGIGGWLGSQGDYYRGAWLAVGGSLLSMFLCALLPEGIPRRQNSESEKKTIVGEPKLGAWEGMKRVGCNYAVLGLLGTKLFSLSASSLYRAARPIMMKEKFDLGPGGLGLSMSAMSLCNAFAGAFVVGPVTRAFSSQSLVAGCLLWMVVCFFGMAMTGPSSVAVSVMLSLAPMVHASVPHICISILQSMAAFSMATALTALSTSQVEDGLKGTLI